MVVFILGAMQTAGMVVLGRLGGRGVMCSLIDVYSERDSLFGRFRALKDIERCSAFLLPITAPQDVTWQIAWCGSR
jgi:hypothetical protein